MSEHKPGFDRGGSGSEKRPESSSTGSNLNPRASFAVPLGPSQPHTSSVKAPRQSDTGDGISAIRAPFKSGVPGMVFKSNNAKTTANVSNSVKSDSKSKSSDTSHSTHTHGPASSILSAGATTSATASAGAGAGAAAASVPRFDGAFALSALAQSPHPHFNPLVTVAAVNANGAIPNTTNAQSGGLSSSSSSHADSISSADAKLYSPVADVNARVSRRLARVPALTATVGATSAAVAEAETRAEAEAEAEAEAFGSIVAHARVQAQGV